MVPEGWELKTLGSLTRVYDGTHQTPKYVESGIPFYSVEHLTSNNFNTQKFISEDVYEKEASRVRLQTGDILMTRIGDIGTAKLIDWDVKASFYVSLALIKRSEAFHPEYLTHFINSDRFQQELWKRTIHVAFPKKINLGEISNCIVVLPGLAEQKKIAKTLSTWDKAITTTEQLLASSQQQKKALMQQLLTGKKRVLDENGVRFSGEWRFATFDEIFQVANKKTAQVKSSSYLESGAVPIVDQGKKLIGGYCNTEITFHDVPVIVFGDHTRCVKWIDFEFCPGADGTQVLKAKPLLDIKFAYYLLSNTDIPNLGYSRHMRELKEKDFKIPVEIEEQVAIAKSLTVAEQKSCSLAQKMNYLKEEKKALMQQLLTGKRRVKVDEEVA